jgi:hypothetical protein
LSILAAAAVRKSTIETCPPLARWSLPAIRVAVVTGPCGGILN